MYQSGKPRNPRLLPVDHIKQWCTTLLGHGPLIDLLNPLGARQVSRPQSDATLAPWIYCQAFLLVSKNLFYICWVLIQRTSPTVYCFFSNYVFQCLCHNYLIICICFSCSHPVFFSCKEVGVFVPTFRFRTE